MNSRATFYIVVSVMILVSGYVVYRLWWPSEPSSVAKKTESSDQVKPNSGLRFSDSVGKPESVWSDPRLKVPGIGEQTTQLKTSAEVENNLKVLTSLYDQGSDEEFLKRLKALIAENPNVKEYAALLGDFYYNEGNWPEAEIAVKRLIELDPQNNFAKTSLGEIFAIQGRYDDGLQMSEQVLKADPKNVDAMYGMLSINEMKGAGDAGYKAVENLYKSDPSNGNAGAVLADAQFARGNTGEAYRMIQETMKADPNPLVVTTAAKIAARQGHFAEAAKWAEEAAAKAPEVGKKIENLHLGWQARAEIKDFNGARTNISKILELRPDDKTAFQAVKTIKMMEEEAEKGKK